MVVSRGRPSASADVPTPSLPVFAGSTAASTPQSVALTQPSPDVGAAVFREASLGPGRPPIVPLPPATVTMAAPGPGIAHRISPTRRASGGSVPVGAVDGTPQVRSASAAAAADADPTELVGLLAQFYSSSERQRTESAERARQYEERQTQLGRLIKHFLEAQQGPTGTGGEQPTTAAGGQHSPMAPDHMSVVPPMVGGAADTHEAERLSAKCHQLAAELVQSVKRNEELELQLQSCQRRAAHLSDELAGRDAEIARLRQDLACCHEENDRLRRHYYPPSAQPYSMHPPAAPALVAAHAILVDAEATMQRLSETPHPGSSMLSATLPVDAHPPLPPQAAPAANASNTAPKVGAHTLQPPHRASTASSYAASSIADGMDPPSRPASVVHMPHAAGAASATDAHAITTDMFAKPLGAAPVAPATLAVPTGTTRQASVSSSIFASIDGGSDNETSAGGAVGATSSAVDAPGRGSHAATERRASLHEHGQQSSILRAASEVFGGAPAVRVKEQLAVHEVFTSYAAAAAVAKTDTAVQVREGSVRAVATNTSARQVAQQTAPGAATADVDEIRRVDSIEILPAAAPSALGARLRGLAYDEEAVRAAITLCAAHDLIAVCTATMASLAAVCSAPAAAVEPPQGAWSPEPEPVRAPASAVGTPQGLAQTLDNEDIRLLKERVVELENEAYELEASKELAEATCEEARQRIAALEASRDAWWKECSSILRQMADRRREAAASLQELDVLRREVEDLRSQNQLLETSVMASAGDPVDVQNNFLELQAELQLERERRESVEAQLKAAIADGPASHQLQLEFLTKELDGVRAALHQNAAEEKKRRLAEVRSGQSAHFSPVRGFGGHGDAPVDLASELARERQRREHLEDVVADLRAAAAAAAVSPSRQQHVGSASPSPHRERAVELLADEVHRERRARVMAEARLRSLGVTVGSPTAGGIVASPPGAASPQCASPSGRTGGAIPVTPLRSSLSAATERDHTAPPADLEACHAHIEELSTALAVAATDLELRRARIEEANVELKKSQLECDNLQEMLEASQEREQLLEEQKDTLLKQLEEALLQLQDEKIARSKAVGERNRMGARMSVSPERDLREAEGLRRTIDDLEAEVEALQRGGAAVEHELQAQVKALRAEAQTLRVQCAEQQDQINAAEETRDVQDRNNADLFSQLTDAMRQLQEERIARTRLEQDRAVRQTSSVSPTRARRSTEALQADLHRACGENVTLTEQLSVLEERLATAEALAESRMTQLAHYQAAGGAAAAGAGAAASPNDPARPPARAATRAQLLQEPTEGMRKARSAANLSTTGRGTRKPALPKFERKARSEGPRGADTSATSAQQPDVRSLDQSVGSMSTATADARRARGSMQRSKTSHKLVNRRSGGGGTSTGSAIRSILGVASPDQEGEEKGEELAVRMVSERRSEVSSVDGHDAHAAKLPMNRRQMLEKTHTYSHLRSPRSEAQDRSISPSLGVHRDPSADGLGDTVSLAITQRSKSAAGGFLTSRELLLSEALNETPEAKLGDLLDREITAVDAESRSEEATTPKAHQTAAAASSAASQQAAAREAQRVAQQVIHGSPSTLGPGVTDVHVRLNVSPIPEDTMPQHVAVAVATRDSRSHSPPPQLPAGHYSHQQHPPPSPQSTSPAMESMASSPPAHLRDVSPRRSQSQSQSLSLSPRGSRGSGRRGDFESERAAVRAAVEEEVGDMLEDLRAREEEMQARESQLAEERRRVARQSLELRSMETHLNHQAEALQAAEFQAAEDFARERSRISAERTRMASLQSRQSSRGRSPSLPRPQMSPPKRTLASPVRAPTHPATHSPGGGVRGGRSPSPQALKSALKGRAAGGAVSPPPRSPADMLKEILVSTAGGGGMTTKELKRMLQRELHREAFVGSGASSKAPRASQSPHTLATPEKTVALQDFLAQLVQSSQRRRGRRSDSRSSSTGSASSSYTSSSASSRALSADAASPAQSAATAPQTGRPSRRGGGPTETTSAPAPAAKRAARAAAGATKKRGTTTTTGGTATKRPAATQQRMRL